jgi:hypothetical protein
MTSPLSGNVHQPRILPLPIRKVMQEESAAQEGDQAPLGSGARSRAAGIEKRARQAASLRRAKPDAGGEEPVNVTPQLDAMLPCGA